MAMLMLRGPDCLCESYSSRDLR